VSQPTPDPVLDDEEFLSRLVAEAGDPKVEPRPEHVAELRAVIANRLWPRRADRPPWMSWPVICGLAAACLVAVFAWLGRDGMHPDRGLGSTGQQTSDPIALRPRKDRTAFDSWRSVRQDLDVSAMPGFSWPLEESPRLSVLTSIPADLLD
jgi:hypothetical protein